MREEFGDDYLIINGAIFLSEIKTYLLRSCLCASSSVTLKTDYLVIGDLSSRDWKFSSFGRKIEKAIEYRDSGKSDVAIISEQMWLERLMFCGVI